MSGLWKRIVCGTGFCKGTWPLAFIGTPLAKPCPRCGRVRFWS